GKGAEQTPELRSVTLAYRTLNLPPELGPITIPDLSAGDGTTRRTKLDIKWEASDPNDDDLEFTLSIRKEDWLEWIRLGGDAPLAEKQFAWDTTTVPAGLYRLKIVASDSSSNPPGETMERSRESEPFIVDHISPGVALEFSDGRIACKL